MGRLGVAVNVKVNNVAEQVPAALHGIEIEAVVQVSRLCNRVCRGVFNGR